jgi:hypothetical protein
VAITVTNHRGIASRESFELTKIDNEDRQYRFENPPIRSHTDDKHNKDYIGLIGLEFFARGCVLGDSIGGRKNHPLFIVLKG